ncbi:hypothetical protein JOF28_001077 [Leucobacter exalbidus]|uniref:Uncharacterized protein n=1 Tax=Leucobacter exalbidus TaxID=662960 RepID=A0A940T0F3_9MICO|nr:hypothetical protein [Leucobacter exalbidus]
MGYFGDALAREHIVELSALMRSLHESHVVMERTPIDDVLAAQIEKSTKLGDYCGA